MNWKLSGTQTFLPLLLIILVPFVYLGCAAQPLGDPQTQPLANFGAVRGKVVHEVTREPLSNVQVTVDGVVENQITNADGVFTFSQLIRGNQQFEFFKTGFEPRSEKFIITSGGQSQLEVALKQIPHIASITVSSVTQNGVDVSWTTPGTVSTGYIQFGANGKTLAEFSGSTPASTTHSVSLFPLASGTLYQFQIIAFDSLNEANFNSSPIQSFSTGSGLSPRMGAITINTSSDRATLSWFVDQPSFPRVYFGTSIEALQAAAPIGTQPLNLSDYTNQQSVTLTGLNANTLYLYVAESVDQFLESSLNIGIQNAANFFFTDPLTAVTLNRPDQVTDTTARLTFSLPNDDTVNKSFSHYQAELFLASPTSTLASPTAGIIIQKDKLAGEILLDKLTAGTTYWVRVQTVDPTGNQEGSNFQKFTTPINSVYWDTQFNDLSGAGPFADGIIFQGNNDGSGTDGFLVGAAGQIYRITDHKKPTITGVLSPTTKELDSITGEKNNLIAAGNKTLIHWNGTQWSRIIFPDKEDRLVAGIFRFLDTNFQDCIYNPNTGNFILVGQLTGWRMFGGTNSFDGVQVDYGFDPDPALASHTLTGIATYGGEDNVVIIGTRGLLASYSYSPSSPGIDFHQTSAQLAPAASTTLTFLDISILDHNHGWIVGEGGLILRINGTPLWDEHLKDDVVNEGILRVAAVNNQKAYAITSDGKLLGYDETISPNWRIITRYQESLRFLQVDREVKNGYNLAITGSKSGVSLFRVH